MRIQFGLAALVCVFFAVGKTGALYSDDRVFEEARKIDKNAPWSGKRLKFDKVDPASVAYILSQDPFLSNSLLENPLITAYTLIRKINRFSLEDCRRYNLKARHMNCEQLKEVTIYGFTHTRENIRLFCRAALQLVAKECVRRGDDIVELGIEDRDYLNIFGEELERTEKAKLNGDTLDDNLVDKQSELEKFIYNPIHPKDRHD